MTRWKFSALSLQRKESCVTELQRLAEAIIKEEDCSVLCGHRSSKEQNIAWQNGNSSKLYPDSKHNVYPSEAIDFTPFPVDWEDKGRLYMFAQRVISKAKEMDINLICGADWDGDGWTNDQRLHDLVHFEIKK